MSFTYANAEQFALEKVSFAIGRGEKVALIGPNGAGKSTLIIGVSPRFQILWLYNEFGTAQPGESYSRQVTVTKTRGKVKAGRHARDCHLPSRSRHLGQLAFESTLLEANGKLLLTKESPDEYDIDLSATLG